MKELERPSFKKRALQEEKLSSTLLQELFYHLPDDLIHLPHTHLILWKKASREISASAKRADLDAFLKKLLSKKEIKQNKAVIRNLNEYQQTFYIPQEEGALRLRLFIGREKKKILRILSDLDVDIIEKLQKEIPAKEIPPFFGPKFFQELYLFKGLHEALLMPPGQERSNLQGSLFQIAMWDGFTRYAVKAMRDLNELEMRVIFLEYVQSLYAAKDETSLHQALLFIDLLLSDNRLTEDLVKGAILNGIDEAFHMERSDLAYLFSTLMEKDSSLNIHLLNLKQQINAGEVERAFDYYDAMIPQNEELIEHFFDLDLSKDLRVVEEIASRCEGLSNGPLRTRCSAKLVRLFIMHGQNEAALDLVSELPCGEKRDSILHTACGMLIIAKNLDALKMFIHLFTPISFKGMIKEIDNLIGKDANEKILKILNEIKTY
jgi:hypothetical protein